MNEKTNQITFMINGQIVDVRTVGDFVGITFKIQDGKLHRVVISDSQLPRIE